MIDFILYGMRDTLTILAVSIIYCLLIWIIAMCVGYSGKDDNWP